VRRLAERDFERADQVRLGHAGNDGELGQIERPRVVAVHGVAGAQHPPVFVLD
jgi:hypothetical protein